MECFKKVIFYKSTYKDAWKKLKEAKKKFLEEEKLK